MDSASTSQDYASFIGKLPQVWNAVLAKYIIDKI